MSFFFLSHDSPLTHKTNNSGWWLCLSVAFSCFCQYFLCLYFGVRLRTKETIARGVGEDQPDLASCAS